MVSFGDLPKEVLLDILSLVPARDLVWNCRPVCSRWRDVVDLDVLWKRKCQWGGYHVVTLDNTVQDWRAFYFLCSLKKNLIKNPCGEEGLDFWEIEPGQEDAWDFSSLGEPPPFPGQIRSGFGVYSGGKKKQLITLKDHGYWDELMDEMKPDIAIKDWTDVFDLYIYILNVKLLAEDLQVLGQCETKDLDIIMDDNEYWTEVSYTFRNCPRGVRHILFEHGITGVDSGALTNSWVTIAPHLP
ncbi:F-box only protein 6-like isoform X2 [Sceloporus undulatus]|uniref:F-box only protein 6-like isoform X2 n=1 Tax=Sceloporus undulatus TaxID=8520 RepID=UPI001C4D7A6D|nr:F-box only protein 6-like isoform X2 [Sceloporus undulatus]